MLGRLHPLAACAITLACTHVDVSTAGLLELSVAGAPQSLGSPAPVEFEAAAALPGETLESTIELTNVAANGVLTVQAVTLDGSPELALEAPGLPLALAFGERATLTVRYTRPLDDASPSGTVTIDTDTVDEAQRRVVVPVRVSDAYPVADVPTVLDFGLVRPGETVARPLAIRNTSSVTLRVITADLPAGPFRLSLDQPLPPDVRVPAQSSSPLVIEVAPTTDAPLEVVLPVVTNETATVRSHPVRLLANVNIAAIEAAGVDFHASYGTRTSPLVIRSTGAIPLVITAVRIGASSDPSLSLTGALPTTEAPWTVPVGQEVAVTVALDTGKAASSGIAGTVEIDSNAMAATTIAPLAATRASQSAPVPVVTLETGGALVAPGTAIVLSGEASYTVQEATDIAGYAWSFLEAPEGAVLPSGDALSTPQLALTPWTSGRYVVGLSVRDTLAQTSLSPAEQIIEVRPEDALWAELTWQATDGTGDPIAADLDLHLVRIEPGDSAPGWFCPSRDCYFDVKSSDWGASGFAEDDPALDNDSVTGPGPEVIHIQSPALGEYALGVYWDSPITAFATGARVEATLRVLRFGDAIATFDAEWPLESEWGVLWYAARVLVTDGSTAATAISPNSIVKRGLACE